MISNNSQTTTPLRVPQYIGRRCCIAENVSTKRQCVLQTKGISIAGENPRLVLTMSVSVAVETKLPSEGAQHAYPLLRLVLNEGLGFLWTSFSMVAALG